MVEHLASMLRFWPPPLKPNPKEGKEGRKAPASQGRANCLLLCRLQGFGLRRTEKKGLGMHNSWYLVTGNEKPLLLPGPAPVVGI